MIKSRMSEGECKRLNRVDLREMCRINGVKNFWRMNKEEMMDKCCVEPVVPPRFVEDVKRFDLLIRDADIEKKEYEQDLVDVIEFKMGKIERFVNEYEEQTGKEFLLNDKRQFSRRGKRVATIRWHHPLAKTAGNQSGVGLMDPQFIIFNKNTRLNVCSRKKGTVNVCDDIRRFELEGWPSSAYRSRTFGLLERGNKTLDNFYDSAISSFYKRLSAQEADLSKYVKKRSELRESLEKFV